MTKLKIVIASPFTADQVLLKRVLSGNPDVEIVAQSLDLSSTYLSVEGLIPDVVLLSDALKQADEYECMKSLFKAVNAYEIAIQSDAMAMPARDGTIGRALSTHMSPAQISQILALVPRRATGVGLQRPLPPASSFKNNADKIVLIGASTGGIDALTSILSVFPQNGPPTAIVQHTGKSFSQTLVRLLDGRSSVEVTMARQGLPLQEGRVCLAGGIEGHLHLGAPPNLTCQIVDRGPIAGHMPSIDALFFSAVPYAQRVIAVLLTGMGRDGAAGMLALRQAGAITIGQDEATSVVYGMPRAAHEIGAVQTQLALHDIGAEILTRCQSVAAPWRNRQVAR